MNRFWLLIQPLWVVGVAKKSWVSTGDVIRVFMTRHWACPVFNRQGTYPLVNHFGLKTKESLRIKAFGCWSSLFGLFGPLTLKTWDMAHAIPQSHENCLLPCNLDVSPPWTFFMDVKKHSTNLLFTGGGRFISHDHDMNLMWITHSTYCSQRAGVTDLHTMRTMSHDHMNLMSQGTFVKACATVNIEGEGGRERYK